MTRKENNMMLKGFFLIIICAITYLAFSYTPEQIDSLTKTMYVILFTLIFILITGTTLIFIYFKHFETDNNEKNNNRPQKHTRQFYSQHVPLPPNPIKKHPQLTETKQTKQFYKQHIEYTSQHSNHPSKHRGRFLTNKEKEFKKILEANLPKNIELQCNVRLPDILEAIWRLLPWREILSYKKFLRA